MFHRSFPKIVVTLAVLMALVSFAPAAVNAQGSRYSLTLLNTSGYSVYRIYVSSSDSELWGPDQLGSNVLASGGRFTITDIPPGEYDIKFVDQDGDVCKLLHVNVFRDASWELTRQWLVGCEFRH